MFHNQYENKNCAFCQGSGRTEAFLDLFTKQLCPACGGQGSVLVTPPARNCAYCSGRGKIDHIFDLFFTKRCPACNGTGWAHVVYD